MLAERAACRPGTGAIARPLTRFWRLMTERESQTVLSGRVEVDDAYMGGARHEGKRSRGAPGKTPFVVAVETDPKHPARVLRMRMKVLRNVDGKGLKARFSSGFVADMQVLTDGWKAYRFLDGDGFKHESHKMPGGMAPHEASHLPLGEHITGKPEGKHPGGDPLGWEGPPGPLLGGVPIPLQPPLQPPLRPCVHSFPPLEQSPSGPQLCPNPS